MTNEHINRDRLLAFAAGELSDQDAAEVEVFLNHHAEAARLVECYRLSARSIATDDSTPPPAATIERAKRIARVAGSAHGQTGWVSRVQEVIASLVFDSHVQSLAVRDEPIGERVQLAYEAQDIEIELQAEPAVEGWRVVGQIDAGDADGASAEGVLITFTRATSTDALVTTYADDRGMFSANVARGRYNVQVHMPQQTIVLRNVELE